MKVNAPGDSYEQEADRVADRVVGSRFAERGPTALSPVAAGEAGAEQAFHLDAGSGRALGASERAFFETRLGHDFSRVRVHTDAAAQRMTQRLGARAFTHGGDLYFARGQYDPRSNEGRRLLAHELSHVVQQRARGGLIQREEPTGAEKTEDEEEKKEKLKSALIADYGLADVVNGSSEWTSHHLEQVTEALKLLPARDKEALKGVTLSRVQRLSGSTAGRFTANQSVEDTTVVNEAIVELADSTFKEGGPSHALIVHEVGHAVASLPLRTAVHAENLATAKFNRQVGVSNAAVGAFYEAVEARNETVDPLNDARTEFNDARKSGDKNHIAAAKASLAAKNKDFQAKKREEDRLKAIWKKAEKETKKAKKTAEKKEQEAARTRISAKDLAGIKKRAEGAEGSQQKSLDLANKQVESMSDEDKGQSAAYVSAIESARTKVDDFVTKTKDQSLSEDDVENLVADVQKTLDERDDKRNELTAKNKDNAALTAYASVERDQDAWFEAAKAHSLAHNRTARVQKFVKFVEGKNIDPITAYARENWPHKPEEFYAEAYSMYQTNPNDLKAASEALYDWFKANKY